MLKYRTRPSSLSRHLSQNDSECLIQPRQSSVVTVIQAAWILGVKVPNEESGFLLIYFLILDQHSSIGLRKGE